MNNVYIIYNVYIISVIKTPNVKYHRKQKGSGIYLRKPRPDDSDFERYADVIEAYRSFLKLTALSDDLRLGRHGRCIAPEDRDKLVKWVQSPKNLDLVAESFRRTCSGYVSTGRLFAVQSGPYYTDWKTVRSMLQTAEDVLRTVCAFMDISGRGKLSEDIEKLDGALETIVQVKDSILLADMIASLPTEEERAGDSSD